MTTRMVLIAVTAALVASTGAATAKADFHLSVGYGRYRPVVYAPTYCPPPVVYYGAYRPVYRSYYAHCGPRYYRPVVRHYSHHHARPYYGKRVVYRY